MDILWAHTGAIGCIVLISNWISISNEKCSGDEHDNYREGTPWYMYMYIRYGCSLHMEGHHVVQPPSVCFPSWSCVACVSRGFLV